MITALDPADDSVIVKWDDKFIRLFFRPVHRGLLRRIDAVVGERGKAARVITGVDGTNLRPALPVGVELLAYVTVRGNDGMHPSITSKDIDTNPVAGYESMPRLSETMELMCKKCGVLVRGVGIHEQWHAAIETKDNT